LSEAMFRSDWANPISVKEDMIFDRGNAHHHPRNPTITEAYFG